MSADTNLQPHISMLPDAKSLINPFPTYYVYTMLRSAPQVSLVVLKECPFGNLFTNANMNVASITDHAVLTLKFNIS